MENKTYVVVGVHTTLEFLDEARKEGYNHKVYAFEPNPFLLEELKTKSLPSNYHIIPKAVSDKDGTSDFFIHTDTYSSSLYGWGTGPQYGEFSNSCVVDTIKLETFIKQYQIHTIDYLHIDAQGSDFNVLKSLGESISIVKEGVCESIAPNIHWNLYSGQASFETISDYLIQNGFDIRWEFNTNGFLKDNEVSIYFKRNT